MENKSGIYQITCTENNKVYIGSAVNLNKRKNGHFETLKKNIHKNKHLQNAFNKYGLEKFVFDILEIVEDKNQLINREQHWISFTKCYHNKIGFNRCSVAGSTLGLKHSLEAREKRSLINKGNKFNLGKKASEETRGKILLAHKGNRYSVGRILSEETRKMISENNKGKQTMLGKNHSIETRKKMSDKRTGIKLSEETKNRMSITKTGTKLSEKTKEKISKSHSGKLNPFYNKKHSQTTRDKMKSNHKGMSGRKHSEATKQKIRETKASRKKIFSTG